MNERGNWYVDLLTAGAATAACTAGVLVGLDGPLRLLAAAPLGLFLPGYALVSALFARRASSRGSLAPFDELQGASLGATERLRDGAELGVEGRVALSVLGSIAVVPLAALGADLVGAGIRLRPVLAGVAGTTALGLVVAAVVRARCDPADRFAVELRPPPVLFGAERDRIGEAAIPNVALVVGLVLLASGVGYAALAPPPTEEFTEFYVETDDVTIDSQQIYPDEFAQGQESTLDVYVGNHEGSYTDYTVFAELQRVDRGENGTETAEITDRQRLATRDVSLRANTTKAATLTVTPELSGEDLRMVLYLYEGRPPENPARTTADQTLRMAVTVS